MQHLLWWPLSVSFSLYISYSGTRPSPPGLTVPSFPLIVLSWEHQAGGWRWQWEYFGQNKENIWGLRGGVGVGRATCSKSLGCSTVSQWGQSSPSPHGSSSLSPWPSSCRPPGQRSLAMRKVTMEDQDKPSYLPLRPDWLLRVIRRTGRGERWRPGRAGRSALPCLGSC